MMIIAILNGKSADQVKLLNNIFSTYAYIILFKNKEPISFQNITISFTASSGCNLNAEQKTCLGIKLAEHGIESYACDVATDNKKKREKCHKGFKAFEDVLKGVCDIALSTMCDDEACPQNHNKSTCKKRRSHKDDF